MPDVQPCPVTNDAGMQRAIIGLATVAIIVLATVLRFTRIGAQSLWLDEGLALNYARVASPVEAFANVTHCATTDCANPLYPILLNSVIRYFGDSVLVLRGVSAILGVASVAIIMWAARVFHDRSASLIAGGLASISAFAVWYSQEARVYSLLMFLVALQVCGVGLCLSYGSRSPPWRYRLLLASAVGMALFASILAAISVAALCGAHWLLKRGANWWSSWWPALVAGTPPVLFFVVAEVSNEISSHAVTPLQQHALMNLVYAIHGLVVGVTLGPPQVTLRGTDKLSVLQEYWPAVTLAGAVGVLLLAVVAGSRVQRRRMGPQAEGAQLLFASALIAATLSCGLVIATRINWQPRHFSYMFPIAILVVSNSTSEMFRSKGWWPRMLSVAALVTAITANVWGLYNHFLDPRYAKDDYRGAAKLLIDERQIGRGAALLYGEPDLLKYYGDDGTADLTRVQDDDLVRRLRELAAPGGEVLVVLNRAFYDQTWARRKALIHADFALLNRQSLQYFDFYRLATLSK